MNEDGSNNQPTNQPTHANNNEPENPKGPYRGSEKFSFTSISTKIPKTWAWDEILGGVSILAKQENASHSYVLRAAIIEYVRRHLPGNNQLVLENFPGCGELPLSTAAQEKLTRKDLPPDTTIVTCPECQGGGCRACNQKGSYSEVKTH
jgi:hypothetical protein